MDERAAEPLAGRERPARLPADGGQPACQEGGHHRARRASRRSMRALTLESVSEYDRPPVKRAGHAARPTGMRIGRSFALLASADGCGPRPLGRRQGPPRAKRAPTSARASEGGEVWRRRAASERRRERAKRATAFIRRGVVSPGLGVGLSLSWSWVWLHVPGSEPCAGRMGPVSSWHRTRRATSRRRRVALVDGSERVG